MSREKQIIILEREGLVSRPLESWSYQVHEFLRNIRNRGFSCVPKPIEIDVYNQIEKVSYIKGNVVNYPLTEKASSIEVLKSAAMMLRKYHDATIEYVKSKSYDNTLWKLPKRDPVEVMCHGDYAPYNIVLDDINVIGMIDFDTSHPGPRSWDLAYALYRWSPLNNPNNQDGFGTLTDQVSRARTFCDVYGYKREDRVALPDLIITRLEVLIDFMESEAKSGNITYAQNINEGHAKLYADDILYISNNKQFFIDSLTKKADSI